MKPKPKPVELAVVSGGGKIVWLTPYSEDARDFIETEARTFGKLFPDGGGYILFIGDGYDREHVADYLKSYNDGEAQQ